jgi:heme transporter
MVLKSAAKLKHLAPDAICVADPLAFTGCGGNGSQTHGVATVGVVPATPKVGTNGHFKGASGAKKLIGGRASRNGIAHMVAESDRPVHPVTLWRGRLSVAIDALQTDLKTKRESTPESKYERRSPVETTNVQLPTGDRLLIPTGAEALRLKGYLIMCRNRSRDYAEFADMVGTVEPETAALVLGGMDEYYCCQSSGREWIATQLVRRLADPHPCDLTDGQWPEAGEKTDWDEVKQRCLSVAVAMLEEAR